MNKTAIFVYGTLKKGFRNHSLLEDSLFYKNDSLDGYDLVTIKSLDFPFLLANGNYTVHGEIYIVDDETLSVLDYIEGHPHNYQRTKIGTINYKGEQINLNVYLFDKNKLDEYQIIKSGIFISS